MAFLAIKLVLQSPIFGGKFENVNKSQKSKDGIFEINCGKL